MNRAKKTHFELLLFISAHLTVITFSLAHYGSFFSCSCRCLWFCFCALDWSFMCTRTKWSVCARDRCVCVRCTAVICVAVIINVLIALSSNFVNVCVRNAHEIHSTCRLMRAHTLSLSLGRRHGEDCWQTATVAMVATKSGMPMNENIHLKWDGVPNTLVKQMNREKKPGR